jgi:hypothetical protein
MQNSFSIQCERSASTQAQQAILLWLIAMAVSLISVSPARASNADWKITEIYSNSSGTVQFIELFNPYPAGFLLNGLTLQSHVHTFNFPSNLIGDTTDKFMLLATPGYFALEPASVSADYNLGVNNFFNPNGDTLTFPVGSYSLTFGPGVLPTDGVMSLNLAWGDTSSGTAGPNSPTNFAGQVGHVPEPGAAAALVLAGSLVVAFRRRKS